MLSFQKNITRYHLECHKERNFANKNAMPPWVISRRLSGHRKINGRRTLYTRNIHRLATRGTRKSETVACRADGSVLMYETWQNRRSGGSDLAKRAMRSAE